MENNSKKDVHNGRKIVTAVLGTLILGALGSGLWERLGSPLFDFITHVIIDGIDWVTKSYKDSIYTEASFGFQERSANVLYESFLAFSPLCYLLLIMIHSWLRGWLALKEKLSNSTLNPVKNFMRSSKGFFLLSILTLFVFVNFFISFTRTAYVQAVIKYVNSTIQRIAPYIDDQTEELLWAQYRSVKSSDDYYAFYEVLQKHLKTAGIENHGTKPL